MAPTKKTVTPENVRDEWVGRIDRLLEEITGWAKAKGWLVSLQDKEMNEEQIGTYLTKVLQIKLPQGDLIVEPIARFVSGADGRVDFYAWPSLSRLRLLWVEDHWVARTDSGVDWPNPWSDNTFYELATGLATAP